MLFRQYLRPAEGSASYLFGCVGKSKAVAVDVLPEFIDPMRDVLAQTGMGISGCESASRPPKTPKNGPKTAVRGRNGTRRSPEEVFHQAGR